MVGLLGILLLRGPEALAFGFSRHDEGRVWVVSGVERANREAVTKNVRNGSDTQHKT